VANYHPKPFKILVCDWDGTLVDSMPKKRRNAATVFRELFGARESSVISAYRNYSGIPRRELFDEIGMESIGRALTPEEFSKASDLFTKRNLSDMAQPFPNVRETLQLFREWDIPVAVSSSSVAEELSPRVEKSGLLTYFTAVFASRPGFNKGVDHIEAVCKRLNIVCKGEILFVGDEIQDINLSLAAGVVPGVVTNTVSREKLLDAGARFVFREFKEIINVFGHR
jgi:phosphoglycolate phosphatase-like HAD superfamily hydrolase